MKWHTAAFYHLNKFSYQCICIIFSLFNSITNPSSKSWSFFNKTFTDRCAPLNNLIKLQPLYLKTDKKLCNLRINQNVISTITSSLDPNKLYGWNNLSVRMIKVCGDSLSYPVKFIFEKALKEGEYLDCWNQQMWHLFIKNFKLKIKKKSKTHRPISVLPILGKIFQRLI